MFLHPCSPQSPVPCQEKSSQIPNNNRNPLLCLEYSIFFGGRNQDCYLPKSSQPVHLSLATERIQKTRLFKCCDVVIPREAVISSAFNKIPSRLRQLLSCMGLKVCQTHQGHFWTFKGKAKTDQTKPNKNTSAIEERVAAGRTTA